VTVCKICGEKIKSEDTKALAEGRLCSDCTVLGESAQRLMEKNPKKAIHYFTDLFMQARRRTLAAEKLENCIWEAWWSGQKSDCTTRI
jgi:ribosome-binding protein aMBF1 (putative translation factor)